MYPAAASSLPVANERTISIAQHQQSLELDALASTFGERVVAALKISSLFGLATHAVFLHA